MTINRSALEYKEVTCGAAGVNPVGYYGDMKDVLTFPSRKTLSTATSFSDLATIAENIIMKPGTTMYAMSGELETAGLEGETIGEPGSQSTQVKLEWFRPGTDAENLGFATYCKNRQMFFIVKQQDDVVRLVGSKKFPARVTTKDTTGKKVADAKGITYEITTFDCGPAPVYTGTIPCDSAQDLGV